MKKLFNFNLGEKTVKRLLIIIFAVYFSIVFFGIVFMLFDRIVSDREPQVMHECSELTGFVLVSRGQRKKIELPAKI